MKFSPSVWLGTTLLAVSTFVSAQASVLFTVTRLSDKVATITASGTLDGPQSDYNAHILVFDGLVTGLAPLINGYFWENAPVFEASSTMSAGSSKLDFAYTAGPGDSLTGKTVIYAGAWSYKGFNVGDEVTGKLVLDLTSSAGILAPATSTGNVYWGVGGNEHSTGVYNIESANVPEPTSLVLLGVGLLGVSAARRTRRHI